MCDRTFRKMDPGVEDLSSFRSQQVALGHACTRGNVAACDRVDLYLVEFLRLCSPNPSNGVEALWLRKIQQKLNAQSLKLNPSPPMP